MTRRTTPEPAGSPPAIRVPFPLGTWARSPQGRRRLLRAALAGNAVLTALMAPSEITLRRRGGQGIVAFELAGTPDRATALLAKWGPHGRAAARRQLYLDYPYMLTYGLIGVLLTAAAEDRSRRRHPPTTIGALVAWAQIAAVASDAIENAALLGILRGQIGILPAVARRAALTKFGLLGLGLGYTTNLTAGEGIGRRHQR
ncbi:MAG TPA: hypothetical protein VHN80_00830 [Kineosporiaceae bacterium]|nr:hypothetical protein [Kineosporiaceae bacterium]